MSSPDLDPLRLRRAVMQSLSIWQSAGLTHLPHVEVAVAEPVSVPSNSSAINKDESLRQSATDSVVPPTPENYVTPDSSALISPQEAPPLMAKRKASNTAASKATGSSSGGQSALDKLAKQVAACTKCQELAEARTQTVFGVGDPNARVMFVGEAPGADEDAQGEPFVGKAGKLLNRIIEACGWKREELYICNILRCRPPGNRNPTETEAANCREFLDGQIAIVKPEYIVCWGSVAAKNLLGVETPIGKMRQQWYDYAGAKVLCTYHPSYLLRNPSAKVPVWDDMKLLLGKMGLEPPTPPEK